MANFQLRDMKKLTAGATLSMAALGVIGLVGAAPASAMNSTSSYASSGQKYHNSQSMDDMSAKWRSGDYQGYKFQVSYDYSKLKWTDKDGMHHEGDWNTFMQYVSMQTGKPYQGNFGWNDMYGHMQYGDWNTYMKMKYAHSY